jgi:peptidoglycan hydrolase-like protein with peptidoglycan-binding domain
MIKLVLTISVLTSFVVSPTLFYAQGISNEISLLTESATSCLIRPLKQLRKGSEDKSGRDDVFRLQKVLQEEGFLKVEPNGYFGNGTQSALRVFQKKNGISTTGILGPLTLKEVNNIACKRIVGESESVFTPSLSSTTSGATSKTPTPLPEKDQPVINSFSFFTNSSGVQLYTASILNVDAVSIKASCPSGISELRNSVGLVKAKIVNNESVCNKEKYLYLADSSQASRFERVSANLVFVDRAESPSWFAFDATTTPSIIRVPVSVKACLRSTCVQKSYSLDVKDFF